jgi:hypothetical protein
LTTIVCTAEAPAAPPAQPPAPEQLPKTGAAPMLALLALLTIGGALGARRFARR